MTKPEQELREDVPCGHYGCLNHLKHPCESCGRIGGNKMRGDLWNLIDDITGCNLPGRSTGLIVSIINALKSHPELVVSLYDVKEVAEIDRMILADVLSNRGYTNWSLFDLTDAAIKAKGIIKWRQKP